MWVRAAQKMGTSISRQFGIELLPKDGSVLKIKAELLQSRHKYPDREINYLQQNTILLGRVVRKPVYANPG